MPFGREGVEPGLGLALSGGGFRATLFHLGSLWRLNEAGLLQKLKRVSSVSGGSITNGVLGLAWDKLTFVNSVATNFPEIVAAPLRDFCRRDIDLLAIGEGALLPWKTASDVVQEQYSAHLFGDGTLQDLPASPPAPRFVFNSTNFATGVDFRFSRLYAGDYRIGLIRNPGFRVATAVAASSAFPPFLSPVVIETDPSQYERVEGADLFDQESHHRKLLLTDGGVYDNLGLETVWNRYDTVLVSDGGAPFELQDPPGAEWHRQALRAMSIATNQARGLRKRALMSDFRSNQRQGAYWGIMVPLTKYEVPELLPCPPEKTSELAAMRTRLNRFSEREQGELINWGYVVCDAALRRYMPATTMPQPQWPVREFPLG